MWPGMLKHPLQATTLPMISRHPVQMCLLNEVFTIILIGPMPIPFPELHQTLHPGPAQFPFPFCVIAIITGGAAPIGHPAKTGSLPMV